MFHEVEVLFKLVYVVCVRTCVRVFIEHLKQDGRGEMTLRKEANKESQSWKWRAKLERLFRETSALKWCRRGCGRTKTPKILWIQTHAGCLTYCAHPLPMHPKTVLHSVIFLPPHPPLTNDPEADVRPCV